MMVLMSCSTQKNTYLNRNYHSITSGNNILYNGYVAFYKGVEEVNSTYKDNFWEILPIEPIQVDTRTFTKDDKDELGLDAQIEASSPNFAKAEEKAVKAVQKHSMLIDNREYNYKIDDAYLLLGKSRYYSSRFIPALEAFNYTLKNYQNANLINETKIWQAKTLVRLRNYEQAIENLTYMLASKNTLSKRDVEEGNTALAMAYVKLDSTQKTIHHLNKATKTAIHKEQTARNLFILGQLYQRNQEIDSSLISFRRVLKTRWIPRKYRLHAKLEMARNQLLKDGEIEKANKQLLRLTKNYDYKSYLGAIYYQLGMLNKNIDTTAAVKYYNKALKEQTASIYEKELAYQELGDIYFNKADYFKAGQYYDSILQTSTDKNSKRLRQLKRRREKLEDVIKNELIVKKNDSILKLLNMSQEDQIKIYKKKLNLATSTEESTKENNLSGLNQIQRNTTKDSRQWYFYNEKAAAFGQQEFLKIWGNRLLEDNWRLSNTFEINSKKEDEVIQNPENDKKQEDDLQTYLNEISEKKERIPEISDERNYAYLSLGIIYKEQFNEEQLAIERLEKLLSYQPKKEIELLATYHLFRIFEKKNEAKANSLKKDILTNFPSSVYASIIGEKQIEKSDDSQVNTKKLEKLYEEIYCDYDYLAYDLTIRKCNIAIENYHNQVIISKFELLKAYAVGKKYGTSAFIEALNYVALNYPNTEEGQKAKEISAKLAQNENKLSN